MPAQTSFLGEYLRARRALVRPADVGIDSSRARRVPGLRRSEVAGLAGISQEYYLRLEQGRDRRPSHQVLGAIVRALRLDDVALEHMHRLARLDEGGPTGSTTDDGAGPPAPVEPALLELVDGLSGVPAMLMSAEQDVLASNTLARAIRPRLLPGTNFLFHLFTDRARAEVIDWEDDARRAVANLRFHGDPRNARHREVVGTLAIRDATFRELWARHDVEQQVTWVARIRLATAEPVELTCHSLAVPGGSGRSVMTLTAEPGTAAALALQRFTAMRRGLGARSAASEVGRVA
ncbi:MULTISPECIES: helix-turn-helix domain-containing protein [unclassified Curtobacterium]|jgi:transcriptional regulator with XRE-family HTH domain|uniref:helix-turn-helix domain-containing protein n=1 Tax=unclassified Curtobacterium TaxID=257496 RepID=UPI0008DE4912|nr:helix-turn-helix transcriptional regulator [Curtobacterium sp. MCBA15_016]OII24268.1 hypothetical protein BIV03_10615 [Curtobacterium sp. MCBA15_016]